LQTECPLSLNYTPFNTSFDMPQVLLQLAERQLCNGISTLVDTPLAKFALYQAFKDMADQVGSSSCIYGFGTRTLGADRMAQI